ncbi:beta-ketoacyl synthase N-terminal-like domain-containing protein, partial [Streptomyces hainanensis]|uniref:beta-ketoacyl synthase N-terminal-like domain-containing protein n=1 Tax=Streptomyces hainanensis TaxID=402648 RepID=UPI003C7D0DD1
MSAAASISRRTSGRSGPGAIAVRSAWRRKWSRGSGSLTALHLACQGLDRGDCEIALVGGANAILAPT